MSRYRPIQLKNTNDSIVIWERNFSGNCVLGSCTISMTEKEKDSGLYWKNNSKDVKETERDPYKNWSKDCPDTLAKVDNLF